MSSSPRALGATPLPAVRRSRKKDTPKRRVALVLQGGGAMGAYQAGVYRAMSEAGIEPDLIVGSAFGTVNAALIAGSPTESRLARLDAFWTFMSERSPHDEWSIRWLKVPDFGRVVTGVPGFFAPNLHAALGPDAKGALYQLSLYRLEIEEALLRHIDFDRMNHGGVGLALHAVNVRTGNFRVFDNRLAAIGPEHILAALAVPPYFPAVRIEGEHYWSGELFSSITLELAGLADAREPALVVAVTPALAMQPEPQTLAGVIDRQQTIRESAGHRLTANHRAREAALLEAARRVASVLSPEQRALPALKKALAAIDVDARPAAVETLNLQPRGAVGRELVDYTGFTSITIEAMRTEGWRDAQVALAGLRRALP